MPDPVKEHMGPTWYTVTAALAVILISVLSFLLANFSNRLAIAEATLAARGERITLLEAKVATITIQSDKIASTLDRMADHLVNMRTEHTQLLQNHPTPARSRK